MKKKYELANRSDGASSFWCESNNVIKLGPQVVTNRFLHANETAPVHDMTLRFDDKYGSMHLEKPFPVADVCPRSDWITNFEPEGHLDDLVEDLTNILKLSSNDVVAGFSFKDQSTLDRLARKFGLVTKVISPEIDLGVKNPLANVETLQQQFSPEKSNVFRKKFGPLKIFFARHVVEHAYEISIFLDAVRSLICDTGYAYFEIPDCAEGMSKGDCSILWEEHIHYFSAASFEDCLTDHGFEVVYKKQWHYPMEDSIGFLVRVFETRRKSRDLTPDFYRFFEYSQKLEVNRELTIKYLKGLVSRDKRICMLGAGHLAATFLSINQISGFIDFVVDDNDDKVGMFMPIGEIPIVSEESFLAASVDLCLMSANPQHHQKIIERFPDFVAGGGKLLSIFPGTQNYFLDEKYEF